MSQSEIILNLMQNIVDKLDQIFAKVNREKEGNLDKEILKSVLDYPELIKRYFYGLTKDVEIVKKNIKLSEKQIKDTIIENTSVVQNHQTNEYILFGKDTPFTSIFLLMSILVVLISSFSFKYIPDYVLEKSTLKLERDQYKLFYQYVFLNNLYKTTYIDLFLILKCFLFYQYVFLNTYDNHKPKSDNVANTFNNIKKNDSSLLLEIGRLSKKYNKEIQKTRLEKQLRILNTEE